jgi:hypothetical protein
MELVLYPFLSANGWTKGLWVFDDERTQIKNEPFVRGMTEMITKLVNNKGLTNPEKGFKMSFSAEPMNNADAQIQWTGSENPDVQPGEKGSALQSSGNWYEGTIAGEKMKGWLCPALGCYFDSAPKQIFIRVENLPTGINPVWNPKPGENSRCFVTGEKL